MYALILAGSVGCIVKKGILVGGEPTGGWWGFILFAPRPSSLSVSGAVVGVGGQAFSGECIMIVRRNKQRVERRRSRRRGDGPY